MPFCDVEVVFDRSPFYGEGGGQVGDRGMIEAENGVVKATRQVRRNPDALRHEPAIEALYLIRLL